MSDTGGSEELRIALRLGLDRPGSLGRSTFLRNHPVSSDSDDLSSSEVPVITTVDGTLVSFNGTPTLWLNEPLAREVVLRDQLTQQVAEMYRRGYVHRSR